MIIGIINLKKKVLILVIFIGVIMLVAMNLTKKHDTEVNINFDSKIKKEDVVIILNIYGYLLDSYEPKKYIGATEKYIVLYKDSKLQEYKNSNLNKYSDYYIYAKYGKKYAKMKYTNPLVMGDNATLINFFINNLNDINYLSYGKDIPNVQVIAENSFKDLEEFKNNKHDIKMFSYMDKL